MDKKKFDQQRRRALGTKGVRLVHKRAISPAYLLDLFPEAETAPTGYLMVGRLSALGGGLPDFYLRWDEQEEALDVDIYLDGKHRSDLWGVYTGHHTERITVTNSRQFFIHITRGQEVFFSGLVEVCLHRAMSFSDGVSVGDTVLPKSQTD